MSIYYLVTVLEVLCIHTYTTYKCSKRRKSRIVTLLSICGITIAVTAVLLPLAPLISYNDKGNGLFMLFGFLYIMPLYFIFDQPMKHLVIMLSSSWVYTMFVFSFSFRVGSLFSTANTALSAVIVQTLFFVLTLPYYIKLVNNIFVSILRKIDNKLLNSLLTISLSWFIILFITNYIFAEGHSYILEFILLLSIIINAILSYKLSYRLASVNIKAKELSLITKIDILTQLKNREGLYEDVHKKIHSDQPFSIILIDLDKFKSINDTFGHAVGDMYLLEFVETAKALLSRRDGFYRLHGDEFVFLVDGLEVEEFCKTMMKLRFTKNSKGLAFKGLSFGYSAFPTDSSDLSQLLHMADLRMYQRKKEKHRK